MRPPRVIRICETTLVFTSSVVNLRTLPVRLSKRFTPFAVPIHRRCKLSSATHIILLLVSKSGLKRLDL